MEVIKTRDAVGMVIGHDLTEIVPGEFKGVAFKKGHVVRQEDVDHLLRIGKEHLYVMNLKEGEVHEDDAATLLGKMICGPGVHFTPPSEGKINLVASETGLLKINRDLQDEVNDLGDICLATIHGNRSIDEKGLIGGCRVIPLTVPQQKLSEVTVILENQEPLIQVKPYQPKRAAIIVTGSEVFKGRLEDKFGPVVAEKLAKYDVELIHRQIVPDETQCIRQAVEDAKTAGANLIVVTGGMSVDPDDKTPGAIKQTGAEMVAYGTPVLPGAMLLLAYLDGIPVFGLPGCVMFAHTTAFDILLPRVMADETITRRDISRLGHGGQCLKCDTCFFPDCHFGKC
ncbi:molybdopterin-binding protein [Anoxynatronum buryatiense]|uniref:Molybdopterin molybdenumtransferase n=1 Tax=Anoxynatronum buryatiense TaxID=489973 RepID=A0AA46AHH3_9CLOT|nr:molybdopterin-binding protein [Anoxynatronum buryatiense]SMP39395.1 molybdenum cofactor synthesis domain-containing protein [Anoxynatronum buryatiense]